MSWTLVSCVSCSALTHLHPPQHPYTPPDTTPKNPYSKLPSFVPVSSQSTSCAPLTVPPHIQSPSSITSNPIPSPRRKSHDTAWSTEGTYTRTQRPRHDDSPAPPTRPRGLSQPPPLIPLRSPVSHPYQQRKSAWADDAAPAPAPTNAAAAVFIVPPARSTSTLPASSARSTSALAPRMTPYARDGDPLSLRRSAFVPYEPRPFEEADRARARTWRKKIQVRLRLGWRSLLSTGT